MLADPRLKEDALGLGYSSKGQLDTVGGPLGTARLPSRSHDLSPSVSLKRKGFSIFHPFYLPSGETKPPKRLQYQGTRFGVVNGYPLTTKEL